MIHADCQCCWRQETLDKKMRPGSGQPITVFLALDYKPSWAEGRKVLSSIDSLSWLEVRETNNLYGHWFLFCFLVVIFLLL